MDLSKLFATLVRLLPFLVTLTVSVGGLAFLHWLLIRRNAVGHERQVPRQLLLILLSGVALILLLLVLPVSEASRGQLLGLLGVLLTAIIALSSTSFVSNAMAGFMLRLVRNFKPGDFVKVGDQFGRVTERGLFHTEIQTESRDLTTLPNIYLVQNPVTVVRSSGTFVTCTLSIGYDVSHEKLRPLLCEGAERAGLTEPFVRILALGDNAVTYRVSGLLTDVKQLLLKRSELRAGVLDVLHRAEVEIASPALRIEKQVEPEEKFVPSDPVPFHRPVIAEPDRAGKLVFDKADLAETLEGLRAERDGLKKRIQELEAELGSAADEARPGIERELRLARPRLGWIDARITEGENFED